MMKNQNLNIKKKIIKLFLIIFTVLFAIFLISAISSFIENYRGGKQSSKISPDNSLCNRSSPYPNSEQFNRSISFIIDKYENSGQNFLKDWTSDVGNDYQRMRNCIDISYADLSSEEVEGYFTFNEQDSTPDHLVIYVDQNYKSLDDLSSALLLAHELAHARQFVREYYGGPKLDCVQKEVEAFAHQTLFLLTLSKEEQNSVIARIETGNTNSAQIVFSEQLVDWGYDATKGCTNVNDGGKCYLDNLVKNIKTWVVSQPAYQKQCNL